MRSDTTLSMVIMRALMVLLGLVLFSEASSVRDDMFYSTTDYSLVLAYQVVGWTCCIIPIVVFVEG